LPTVTDLRARLVTSLGEAGYKAAFSLLSLASLALLIYGYATAPLVQLWSPPEWTRWLAIVLMLPAFIFLVAAYLPGRIRARLKHPFLVAVKTWALAHLLANGDLASMILFGSFLAYAVYDRIALKHRQPSSVVGIEGPERPQNDIIAIVLGTVLYVVFLVWLHPLLIGHAVLPQ
jgi:uncharacterized membrane protein